MKYFYLVLAVGFALVVFLGVLGLFINFQMTGGWHALQLQ